MVEVIISGARATGSNRHRPKETEPGRSAMNEIDNHADTICAGPNWKLLKLSGEYCILVSSLHVYHGSISRYGHFMLLALTGGRIVFSDRVVFQIVRAGAPSSSVGVMHEASGRTLSVFVA